jgi:hypothetical protein
MATGMAIMGFGGGAMIGAPLANLLMTYFRTPTSVGVWETFLVLAAVYFVFMMSGAFSYRVPDSGRGAAPGKPATADASVHHHDAIKAKQFWLIWAVLCLNVSAGIGVIGMASPMLQEIFGASAAVAAGLHRPDFAVQHRRPLLLGVAVGPYRPQSDLRDVLSSRHRALCIGAVPGARREPGGVRAGCLRHCVDVWRRLRDHSRLPR